jgi:hypothetical protein
MTPLVRYLHRLWDGLPPGWAFLGVGSYPYLDGGHVRHRSFREKPYSWPRQEDQLAYSVLNAAESGDAYITPNLSENPLRDSRRRRSLPSFHLWCDLDGADAGGLARVAMLLQYGSFTVASGRGPGHCHLYVRLACAVPATDLAVWQRRLVAFTHADPSPSAVNAYLRPPETLNHKTRVLFADGSPTHVAIDEWSEGDGWHLADLDRILPVQKGTRLAVGIDRANDYRPAPLPDVLPAVVADIMRDPPDWQGDRSERLFRLVATCRRAGLSERQILTLVTMHSPSRRKYGRRLRTETLRIVLKLRDAEEIR